MTEIIRNELNKTDVSIEARADASIEGAYRVEEVCKGPSLEDEIAQLKRSIGHLQELKSNSSITRATNSRDSLTWESVIKGGQDFSMFTPSEIPGYSALELDYSVDEGVLKSSLLMSLCDVRIQRKGRKHKHVKLEAETDRERQIAGTSSLKIASDERNLYSNFEISVSTESLEVSENGGALDQMIKDLVIDPIMDHHDSLMMSDQDIDGSIDGIGKLPTEEALLSRLNGTEFDEEIINRLIELKNKLAYKYQDGAIFLTNPSMMRRIEMAMKREGDKLNPLAFLRTMKFHTSDHFGDNKVLLFDPKQYKIVATNVVFKSDDKVRRGDLVMYFKQYMAAFKKKKGAFVYLAVTPGMARD